MGAGAGTNKVRPQLHQPRTLIVEMNSQIFKPYPVWMLLADGHRGRTSARLETMKNSVVAVVLSVLVGAQVLAEGAQPGVASTEESLTSQEYLVYDLIYDASYCLRAMGLYDGELPVWGDDWRVQHRLGVCLGMYEAAIRYALRTTPVGGSIERIVPAETGDELQATYLLLYDAS